MEEQVDALDELEHDRAFERVSAVDVFTGGPTSARGDLMPVNKVDIEPVPAPVVSISPSSLNRLLECPRRLAYGRDDTTRHLQKPSTRTALGVAAHGLTEAAHVRTVELGADDLMSWLRQTWDTLVAGQAEQLPGGVARQGCAATSQLAGVRDHKGPLGSEPGPTGQPLTEPSGRAPRGGRGRAVLYQPSPGVERRLDDQASGLFGTPDRVEEAGGRLRVVDLKSGIGQKEMTSGQRRQLLIYTWLVGRAAGRVPDDLVILDVKGEEHVVPVAADAVQAVVDEAKSAVAAFNAVIAGPRVPGSPEPEVCRWCEFRVVCGDFWEARESDWPTHDIAGAVTAVEGARVELSPVEGGRDRVATAGGWRSGPAVGQTVLATDLAPAGPDTPRMRWNSRIRLIT